MKFHGEDQSFLGETLLRFASCGIFAYSTFNIVAGGLGVHTDLKNLLVFATGAITIIQVIYTCCGNSLLNNNILQENIYCSKGAIEFFCLCRFFFSYYLSRMLSDVGYTLAVMILRNLEDKLLHFYSYVTLPCG